MIRFHEAETRAARDSVHWAAADEGRWVTYLMENALGGGPVEFRDAYVDYSPFTYSAPGVETHATLAPCRYGPTTNRMWIGGSPNAGRATTR